MSKRGPAPTPTAILKRRGSWRANLNPEEPAPAIGRPTKPPGLPATAAKVWNQVCRLLEEMKVLSVVDGGQLERYARYLVRWRQCEDFIVEHGLTYPLKSTNPPAYVGTIEQTGEFVVGWREFPEVKESHRLNEALRQIEANFGLTPSARSRIRVQHDEPEPDEDSFEATFLPGPGSKRSG